MRRIVVSAFTPGLCFVSALAFAADPPAAIPSYLEALRAYQTERAKAEGPPVRAEDRLVMEAAARDLAVAMPDPGLQVGDQAPDFRLPNALGRTVRLRDLLEQGPVVLSFYRGAWCPYCNLQLRGLQEALPAIEREGARLLAVTPQRSDKSREQVEKDGYGFEILSDLDERVIKAYRLYFEVSPDLGEVYRRVLSLDLAEYNGDGRYVLPVPATFVIDRRGVIRAAYADVDYRMRMEPAAILAALKAINRP
jgi:peroxiredoxin